MKIISKKAFALFFIPADKFSDFKDNIPNNIETLYNNMKEIKIYPNIPYLLVAAELNPFTALIPTKKLIKLARMSWPDKTDELTLNNALSKNIAYFTLNKESSKDKK